MAIKESLKDVAADLERLREDMRRDVKPKYEAGYHDIGYPAERYYDLAKDYAGMRPEYQAERSKLEQRSAPILGMLTDESQRGYSPEALDAMRGRATGAVAGSRKSTQEELDRRIAASGMAHTGMGLKMGRELGRDTASEMRRANFDIDIAQELAKKEDFWNAAQYQLGMSDRMLAMLTGEQGLLQGMGAAYGGALQSRLGQLSAARALQDMYSAEGELYSRKIPPLVGAHDVSFWSDFGGGDLLDILI
jgi:hypothetical protein